LILLDIERFSRHREMTHNDIVRGIWSLSGQVEAEVHPRTPHNYTAGRSWRVSQTGGSCRLLGRWAGRNHSRREIPRRPPKIPWQTGLHVLKSPVTAKGSSATLAEAPCFPAISGREQRHHTKSKVLAYLNFTTVT